MAVDKYKILTFLLTENSESNLIKALKKKMFAKELITPCYSSLH